MTNEEREPTPEIADSDDIRFAPQEPESPTEAAEAAPEEPLEPVPFQRADEMDLTVTEGMDIEAALAAVSTLSDMLAEQEAAEQARIAQAEAEAQAAAERQARLEHPELFFPVPPMTTLHRGQMASVVPALLLMAIGAWLTFTLTTQAALDPGLVTLVVMGGIGVTLLVRWLSSGRWARGSLFFGLAMLLGGGVLFYLLQPASPGLAQGWPGLLIALGIAFMLTGVLAIPRERRLFLPGIALIVAGIASQVVISGLVGETILATAGMLWPVVLALVVLMWALPLIVRRRG